MFIQKCFIRKNTKELQEKLKALGYHICACVHFKGSEWLVGLILNGSIHGIGYIDKEMFGADWTQEKELSRFLIENANGIDCGTNEELFLAIAALRDDTDKNQWFVTESDQSWVNIGVYAPKGSFELCLVDDRYMGMDKRFCNSIVPAHKASVSELINHFKEK